MKWMASLGIDLQMGRTSNYEKVIGYWKDAYLTASIEEANQAFPDFVSSLLEIIEFTRIHQALQDVPQLQLKSVIEKLKKAVNGPVNAANETPKSTAARNFLFEASVAAMVHRPDRSVEAILNARSDTGIKIEGRKIWVECKRVTTEQALEGNLRKACSQLQETFKTEIGSGHRGIVAMDVSKILNPKGDLLVAKDDADLTRTLARTLRHFADKHSGLWQRIYTEKSRKIIGTVFRLSCLGMTESKRMAVQCSQWAVSPRADATAADVQIQERLVEALSQDL
ncbi:hypothetical protein [Acidovorax sp. MR-S7]|uniref:hypothetical protein n=1 Tax=Acidovorax sp. MR-S7 TaxID=1268622 RepID=UPI0003D3BFAC|nr:hypothetical protein [Acidovorax sp. MR-S7]GAD22057.1 hypothetical protein AVS7_01817 [Acidovorax sp. MR-S7]